MNRLQIATAVIQLFLVVSYTVFAVIEILQGSLASAAMQGMIALLWCCALMVTFLTREDA